MIVTSETNHRIRNLVVVRSGPDSLHPDWLGRDRNWDLAVSSFGSRSAADFPEAMYFDYYKGGKWDGIFRFFANNRHLLSEYDYFWLPDDDIETSAAQINTLFSLMGAHDLELAQPSLSADSYFYHPITLRCPLTRIRHTNFVEVMVPVLSADLLGAILPHFETSQSGWGIDHLWVKLTSDPATKCAIFDAVTVRHTRPVGSVLAKAMQTCGASGLNDMDQLAALFDVHSARPLCFEAETRWGGKIRGTVACGAVQFLAQAPWLSRGRHHRSGARVFFGSLVSHLRLKPDFTRIEPAPAGNSHELAPMSQGYAVAAE